MNSQKANTLYTNKACVFGTKSEGVLLKRNLVVYLQQKAARIRFFK
jgi:hypothetical protein